MTLAAAPKEIDGHGLLNGKVVVVTAAAGTGIGSATARRALLEGADVVVSDQNRAGGDLHEAAQRTQKGGLAAAGSAQKRGECAGSEVEADPVQHWRTAIGDMQVAHLDRRAGARHGLRFRLQNRSPPRRSNFARMEMFFHSASGLD